MRRSIGALGAGLTLCIALTACGGGGALPVEAAHFGRRGLVLVLRAATSSQQVVHRAGRDGGDPEEAHKIIIP